MAYGRPGVAGLCLELQDRDGQSVPLLLWAAWARPDDPALAVRACDLARAWEATAIGPLRAARRGLKPPMPPVPDLAREDLRAQVQAVELAAERVLLETLQALGSPGTAGDIGRALVAVSAAWGTTACPDTLAALAAALG
ncbi:MAG: hypothetical protein JWM33_920 [Caulobacteraceae bacterium]|nr:hypothetical protein [Caulobacteraceae bacterium]